MDISAADRHRSQQPVIEHYVEVGFNFRMTDIQAAIGLVQLRKLPSWWPGAHLGNALPAPARRYRGLGHSS